MPVLDIVPVVSKRVGRSAEVPSFVLVAPKEGAMVTKELEQEAKIQIFELVAPSKSARTEMIQATVSMRAAHGIVNVSAPPWRIARRTHSFLRIAPKVHR